MANKIIDWRDGLKSTLDMNKYMLETEIFADCTFKVGTGNDEQAQVFRCHKMILARNSPVFEAMFYGSLPETSEEIRVTDIEPDIFKLMLTFIYTESISYESPEEARDVAYAANKYMLALLKANCIDYWKQFIDVYNLLNILETDVPALLGAEIEEACVQVLQQHTRLVINHKDFKVASESTVLLILQQDTLSCEEYDLVMAVERWAEHQVAVRKLPKEISRRRTVLEPLIPHMRFKAMSKLEFTSGPGLSHWLTKAEKSYILTNKKNNTVLGISDKELPRNAYVCSKLVSNPNIIMCKKSENYRLGVNEHTKFEIKFKCYENISIKGLRICSQVKSRQFNYNAKRSDYNEDITITLKQNPAVNYTGNFEPQSSICEYKNVSYNSMIDVLFVSAVKLERNMSCILEMVCHVDGKYPVSKDIFSSLLVRVDSNSLSPVEALIFQKL